MNYWEDIHITGDESLTKTVVLCLTPLKPHEFYGYLSSIYKQVSLHFSLKYKILKDSMIFDIPMKNCAHVIDKSSHFISSRSK